MSRFFVDIDEADDNGLLGIGGQLTPARLLDAYSNGIFPWPFEDYRRPNTYLLGWFAPDPRCVFEFETFHISKRLCSLIRSGKFEIRFDTDFESVMRGCADGPGRKDGTWITSQMIAAYCKLHQLGYAHSIETYLDGELAGIGCYTLRSSIVLSTLLQIVQHSLDKAAECCNNVSLCLRFFQLSKSEWCQL